MNTDFKCLK